MSTKDKVLKILESNRATPISGEEMAERLGVSRTAVWKAVKTLKEEGHTILSKTNSGYKLDAASDVLDKWAIAKNLDSDLQAVDIRIYDTIDSTNTEAKRLLATEDLSNFTLLVANEQTKGRGRQGKTFASPKSTGVYFSIVFFPRDTFSYSSFDLVTIKAAVAVVDAIEKTTGTTTDIKWVNDIFLGHKKICGILTEADTDFESRKVRSIITGIGINITTEFDGSLPAAGSLKPDNLLRSELVAAVVNAFYHALYHMTDAEVLERYKAHSMLLGRDVSFELNGKKYEAVAKDINAAGNLIVDAEGTTMTLSSGEVSVKGQF
ncbi:biotin--[acetyl-CoA-carboxylase] ligase [Peptoniphilus equinus]|uniref:Bifunctional ligase/repressor BirA n=1 Tax=Peptoniphilus equinus TaxID=3016343 RepID=A0ABY7QV95_9FIRM|nr:biotin--[acetyl-CoA-carboxylase] ligase [Peptoniphilus equinus]WBW49828.1 biotin--[acetyl-CoA-carboxylase] ligase [Peptoniphilus equinus]